MSEERKEMLRELLTGELQVTKITLILLVTSCTLFGILMGLLLSPITKGISICSNNGNGNRCANRHYYDDEEEPDRTECIGVCES